MDNKDSTDIIDVDDPVPSPSPSSSSLYSEPRSVSISPNPVSKQLKIDSAFKKQKSYQGIANSNC